MTQTSLAVTRNVNPVLPRIKSGGQETEIKFLVSEPHFKASQHWALLGQTPQRAPFRRLRTVYYDTAQGDLRRHHFSLRMRTQRRGAYIMTLKWNGAFPGSLFERGEIEIPAKFDMPDPALLGAEIANVINGLIEDRALLPVYATDVKRATHRIQSETSDIEIAFDSGLITAGDSTLRLREIEMELKSGDKADLYRLGIAFAETFPVQLGALAKSERGALLSRGEMPAPLRAASPLTPSQTVDDAIGESIKACISQFMGNWPAFEQGDGVTAIHQMRVAMRRLRSVLGLFQRAFPCPEFHAFRDEGKRLASAMGEARNWDVFLLLLREGPLTAFPDADGFPAILAQSETHRNAGYETVRALLAAPATTRFILSIQAFVARRGWRNTASGEALPRLAAPVREFAGASLVRLHNKVAKRGKNLLDLPPHDRHELRIELKKLRYAVDFFGALFENRGQVRNYIRAAARLQDQLGMFNDLIAANEMAARLDMKEPSVNRAAGIVIGWCARGARADDSALREAWKDFRKTKPFF